MTRRFCSALVALALCFSFAGCSPAPDIPQPTLDELLAEVNAEHQNIQRGELDPTPLTCCGKSGPNSAGRGAPLSASLRSAALPQGEPSVTASNMAN